MFLVLARRILTFLFACHCLAEPEKQFALVQRHISSLQQYEEFASSEIVVMVERNLGL